MIDTLLKTLKKKLYAHCSNNGLFLSNNTTYHYTTLEIPVEKPIVLASLDMNNSFFLKQPDSGATLLGLGNFLTLQSKGRDRFSSIKSGYNKMLQLWKNKEQISPIAFLTFAFDENDPMNEDWSGFPNTLISLPDILIKETVNDLTKRADQSLLININLLQLAEKKINPDEIFLKIEDLLQQYIKKILQQKKNVSEISKTGSSSTMSSSWHALTTKAIDEIQSGRIEKIVTSRQISLTNKKNISIFQLSQQLINKYPGCTILSYHLSGKTIIAASPECLLTLKHHDIQSDAIGGTIHRKTTKKQMQNFLSEKNKLLKEHDFIVQDIYQNLDPLCHTLKMTTSPFLMKLHNMYHLETPVQGQLMAQYDLFDVIEKLHPTPAVAGYPGQKAKQWLLDNEHYHRGWYTGAFGYLENDDKGKINGELSVMLRCAVVKKNQITLFAGAGLVAESDPEMEWQETELKMQTIIECLI